MHQELLGIVLCGGRSSRMGRDKAGLPHPAGGGTFLQHAISRLESICDAVVVSGKSDADCPGSVALEDPVAHRGPATGVAAALDYARENSFSACLVTPVDTPFLSQDDLQRLKDAWRACGRLTVAQSDRTEPLIAIYPTELAEELARLAKSDDRSLFRWVESQDHAAVAITARSCRNINSPGDLTDESV